jgi:hypothetical protein
MESISVLDVRLAKMGGNPAAARASEDLAFRQGFNNLFETTTWYGNTETDPEKWMGFSPRFDLSRRVRRADRSAWHRDRRLGPEQLLVHRLGPRLRLRHLRRGPGRRLHIEELPVDLVTDEDGKEFRAYRTAFDWECGLAVANPLHVVRVPNIDSSAVSASSNLIIQGLTKGYHQLKRGGRTVGYCNPFVQTYLHLQAQYVAINGTLSVDNPAGMPVVSIFGVPIRTSQGLTSSEAIVS